MNLWLGRLWYEPVQIVTETQDLSAELKRGLAFVRQRYDFGVENRNHVAWFSIPNLFEKAIGGS